MKLENEKLINRFLFGEMSEEERFEFEERFVSEADLFEEIKVVEDELIEKYVRGWMNPAERSKFEQHFLTTNKRRERVEFSRRFIKKIEEQKDGVVVPVKKNEETTPAAESFWNKIAAIFSTPKIAMVGGLTVIIAVFGSWVLYTNFVGKPDIVKNENNEKIEDTPETETPIPTNTPLETPENDQDTSGNVNNEKQASSDVNSTKPTPASKENINKTPNKQIENPKKTPVPKKSPPIQKAAPNPILALFAGTVRSGGQNNILQISKNAKAATLQLNLESIDYKTYQAQLTDADGNVIFQRANLKAKKSRINFNIPAKNLRRGDYMIKLNGKNDSGENESVADFQFRVNR